MTNTRSTTPQTREDTPDLAASLHSISSSLSSQAPSEIENLLYIERQAEGKIAEFKPQYRNDDAKKVLSSFLAHLPIDGKRVLATYISNTTENAALSSLALHLYTAVLAPMRACGGKTPDITPSPLDRTIPPDDVASNMIQSPSRREQRTVKEDCLKRDGYRCVISGIFDYGSTIKHPDIPFDPDRRASTEASHIIPFALGSYEGDAEKGRSIAQVWSTLFALFPALENTLAPDRINEPKNVITLMPALNKQFGYLNFALEPTGENDKYKIILYDGFEPYWKTLLPSLNEHGDRFVKFEKHNNSPCELPDPVLFETHAAIARIFHASGKAEQVEAILRERDEIKCLAPNGNTDVTRILPLLLC